MDMSWDSLGPGCGCFPQNKFPECLESLPASSRLGLRQARGWRRADGDRGATKCRILVAGRTTRWLVSPVEKGSCVGWLVSLGSTSTLKANFPGRQVESGSPLCWLEPRRNTLLLAEGLRAPTEESEPGNSESRAPENRYCLV